MSLPPTQPKPALAETRVDPHAAIAARQRADKALHEDVALDYERPFKLKPLDRSATAKLFGEACQYGDKHACIVEAQLVPPDEIGARFHTVLENCVHGDLLSCRALPADADSPQFPNVPGAMSRNIACQKTLAASCDRDALRRECAAGFPAACGELALAQPPEPDSNKLADRLAKLSMQGCRHGIASECMNVTQYGGSDRDQLEMSQRLCDLIPGYCSDLAMLYGLRRDRAGERESFERACEYGKDQWGTCIQLAEGYVDGTLDEPVPDRAQALLNWACPKLLALQGAKLLERHPACKLAKQP